MPSLTIQIKKKAITIHSISPQQFLFHLFCCSAWLELLIVCIYVCLYRSMWCTCYCKCPQKPEQGVGSYGAGVIGSWSYRWLWAVLDARKQTPVLYKSCTWSWVLSHPYSLILLFVDDTFQFPWWANFCGCCYLKKIYQHMLIRLYVYYLFLLECAIL